MLTPGDVLGDRYRLTDRIATGGMGEVWRAEDGLLGRVVAVKILQSELLERPGFVERFRVEARVMATLTHPGVVRVYDYGETRPAGGEQVAYLVMEFIDGEPLSRTLARLGRINPVATMDLMAQAAEALHAAHEHGIVHRDVKPGNLLVRPDGKLVLTDFGIARSTAVDPTNTGPILGTASYVSPEQAAGEAVTAASDVYSLGVVGYLCLAGQRPFEADNPMTVAMSHIEKDPPPLPDDVPESARSVIERAMAKDPEQRWPSAAAMARAARLAGSDGIPPASHRQPEAAPAGRSRKLRFALVALVAALAGAGIAGYALWPEGKHSTSGPAAVPAGPSSPATSASPGPEVPLNPNQFKGMPFPKAKQRLTRKGLLVHQQDDPAGHYRPGQVTHISTRTTPPHRGDVVEVFVQPQPGHAGNPSAGPSAVGNPGTGGTASAGNPTSGNPGGGTHPTTQPPPDSPSPCPSRKRGDRDDQRPPGCRKPGGGGRPGHEG